MPPNLADSAVVARGAFAYAAMCQTCHGGPGARRSVTGEGLAPHPPDLARAARQWSPAETFRILDQGIMMAGMPAYGPTHSDEQLWEIVAVVRTLPRLDSTA